MKHRFAIVSILVLLFLIILAMSNQKKDDQFMCKKNIQWQQNEYGIIDSKNNNFKLKIVNKSIDKVTFTLKPEIPQNSQYQTCMANITKLPPDLPNSMNQSGVVIGIMQNNT